MFGERMHRAYTPSRGGIAVPAEGNSINELGKRRDFYIGTFKEAYFIAAKRVAPSGNTLTLCIRKDASVNTLQKEPDLKGLSLTRSLSYASSDFNTNGGLLITREQLLRIANTMDPTDQLYITMPNILNYSKLAAAIKETCG